MSDCRAGRCGVDFISISKPIIVIFFSGEFFRDFNALTYLLSSSVCCECSGFNHVIRSYFLHWINHRLTVGGGSRSARQSARAAGFLGFFFLTAISSQNLDLSRRTDAVWCPSVCMCTRFHSVSFHLLMKYIIVGATEGGSKRGQAAADLMAPCGYE